MAIHHAASKSSALLSRLNQTPTFWKACTGALQSAAYIALGRVFDLKSPYNLEARLNAMQANLALFQREALGRRKLEGIATTEEPPWLLPFLDGAYYPTAKDVARLRKKVGEYRAIYDRIIMPARHQYLAHRQTQERAKVKSLYGRGKVRELWRLSTYLLRLHQALWDLLHNGRKPVLQATRYSVKSMYDSKSERHGRHEEIVREVKSLMTFIETANAQSPGEATVRLLRLTAT
jgi:hypothetical protein